MGPQFVQCAVMSGQKRAHRLAEQLRDGLELEAGLMAEREDLLIRFAESANGLAEPIQILARGSANCSIHLICDVRETAPERGLPGAPTHLVADAVHRDPEQPRLELALLGVPAAGDVLEDRHKDALRNLLGQIGVTQATLGQRVHPTGISIDQSRPGLALARSGPGHQFGQGFGILVVDVSFHARHPLGAERL